jgi:hypothetical protein
VPVRKHYEGHGDKVMASMRRTYKDPETAKRVFYATENKRKNEKKRGRKRGSK